MNILRFILIGVFSNVFIGCLQTRITETVCCLERSQNSFWHEFQDPLIEWLVHDLRTDNLTIQIGQKRLAAAQEAVQFLQADLFPDLSLSANATRSKIQTGTKSASTNLQTGLNLNWDLDFFGKTRSKIAAVQARSNKAYYNLQQIHNELIAQLITALFEYRTASMKLKLLEDLTKDLDLQIDLLEKQYAAGLIQATAIENAIAAKFSLTQLIPQTQATQKASIYAIEQLTAKSPEELYCILAQHQNNDYKIPNIDTLFQINIDILQNRPDVLAAYQELVATCAEIESAKAELWPQISIGSFFGLHKLSPGTTTPANPIWSLSANLVQHIFNFGKLQSAVRSAKILSEESSLAYQNTILAAIAETKTALAQLISSYNIYQQQDSILLTQQNLMDIETSRFNSGLTDMTSLISSKINFYQSHLAYLDYKKDLAQNYTSFNKALLLAQ